MIVKKRTAGLAADDDVSYQFSSSFHRVFRQFSLIFPNFFFKFHYNLIFYDSCLSWDKFNFRSLSSIHHHENPPKFRITQEKFRWKFQLWMDSLPTKETMTHPLTNIMPRKAAFLPNTYELKKVGTVRWRHHASFEFSSSSIYNQTWICFIFRFKLTFSKFLLVWFSTGILS